MDTLQGFPIFLGEERIVVGEKSWTLSTGQLVME